jgi:hypothetical protein
MTHTRDSADTHEHCEHECVCNKYIDYTNTGATAGRACNGETWLFKPCSNDTRKEEPTRDDLIKFARWTQKFWQEGQEIQRKHGIVIDDLDDKMQKLAFTYYTNLCEIDREVLHLFREGHGDENYGKEHEIYTPEHDAQVASKGELRAYRDADGWGKKYGIAMLPGFIRARITHIERDQKEKKQ